MWTHLYIIYNIINIYIHICSIGLYVYIYMKMLNKESGIMVMVTFAGPQEDAEEFFFGNLSIDED